MRHLHELGDEHGGALVHAGALELHDVAVAAGAKNGDLAAELVLHKTGSRFQESGQRRAPTVMLEI